MSVINKIMKNTAAKWIDGRIGMLPDRAKFRASSAIRSLQWANGIFDAGMPIPACFCALHATEEAVSAFISSAKEAGYEDARGINIKNHADKATVSLLAQKISTILKPYEVAVAPRPDGKDLAVRFVLKGNTIYNDASTNLFHFIDAEENVKPDFHDTLVGIIGDVETLRREIRDVQEARNTLFYATKTGLPTGFENPSESLSRECYLTLGLIWAALDINKNKGHNIIFIEQALKTANIIIDEARGKK